MLARSHSRSEIVIIRGTLVHLLSHVQKGGVNQATRIIIIGELWSCELFKLESSPVGMCINGCTTSIRI
ncbi:hypothetical protein MKW92_009160 [Papaver armeniacum]|nr:hypothetical protein MKW92_009160 [Papaver armeniacum]